MKKTLIFLMVLIVFTSFVSASEAILNKFGSAFDMSNQYIYNYDYAKGNVTVNYDSFDIKYFTGTLVATNLKPNFTYQIKMLGKPKCLYGVNGDDGINEKIGYKGRWTCASCSCAGAACNRNDTEYAANKAKMNADPTKECIQGYLVLDFFTTDADGNAVKAFKSDNSYHVLWCNGGTCNNPIINDYLVLKPSGSSAGLLCDAGKVAGQNERVGCGLTYLSEGNYDVAVALTEESFHQGNWATVLLNDEDVHFTISSGHSGGGGSSGGSGDGSAGGSGGSGTSGDETPIPEFSGIAAGLALVGAGAGFVLLRKKK